MRHFASAGRDYDKKSDFVSPDSRGAGASRSASHRYLPTETKATATRHGRHGSEDFSPADFKARWWPAPDA